MIGTDTCFKTTVDRAAAMHAAARLIARRWPQAVFRDAAADDAFASPQSVPWDRIDELLVFRNSEADDLCRREGATAESFRSFIHLLFHQSELTVVHDGSSPEARAMVNAIGRMLDDMSDITKSAAIRA